jgi:hypothetical protein
MLPHNWWNCWRSHKAIILENNMKTLIIEDNPTSLKLTSKVLQAIWPDIILLALLLPGIKAWRSPASAQGTNQLFVVTVRDFCSSASAESQAHYIFRKSTFCETSCHRILSWHH